MIQMRRISAGICLILCAALVLASCDKQDTGSNGSAESSNVDIVDNNDNPDTDPIDYKKIVYKYPSDPVAELHTFLKNGIQERGLPIEIGAIEQVTRNDYDRQEFTMHFSNNNENACVISFVTSPVVGMYNQYDDSLNGEHNPSFTMAFMDQDCPEDMVMILTSVFLYLNPEMSVEEAERLAIEQDHTISIDGFSIPRDMGGYQIQAHYTTPHVYLSTENFDSSLVVTVTALKQIWGADLDYSLCKRLSTNEEIMSIMEPLNSWEEDVSNRSVYADFIVTDLWQYQEAIHYEIFTNIAVKTLDGHQYQFRLDTTRTPYEFGVGKIYTIFIYRNNYGPVIFHAVQHED